MYKKIYLPIIILFIINNTINSQWINVYTASNFFHDSFSAVFFINPTTGYITKRDSAVIKTTDGGLNWTVLSGTAGYDLQDIQFTSLNTGYAVGSNFTFNIGYILSTTNSGNSWNVGQIPGIKVHRVKFVDSNTGYILGDSNYVLKTINGGISWAAQSLSAPYLIDFAFIDANTGFATGGFQRFYKTTNGGNNWSNNSVGPPFANINFVNALTGYFTSNFNNGQVYKTTDGGTSTFLVFSIDSVSIARPFFINANTGWIPASRINNNILNRVLLKTVNGGLNWFEQLTGTQTDSSSCFSSVFMIDSSNGFAVTSYCSASGPGANCKVFKTTNGGGSPIGIINNSEFIESYKLKQNYPNPFNPATKIKFDIPSVGQRYAFDTRLVIYDILGKEAATLVNEQLQPGSYSVNWNAANYPSGVYYYKLTAGNYSETKKMVLIK